MRELEELKKEYLEMKALMFEKWQILLELQKEIKEISKKASAWDRVVSIANDGVGLKASEIKAIEEQMIK